MPAALARLAGNAKLLLRLFGDFRTQNHDIVRQIRETIQAGDHETSVRLLHTVKGVAANLAIDIVAEAAKDAEHAAREQDTTGLNDALMVLEDRLRDVCQSIESTMAPVAAPIAPATPPKAPVQGGNPVVNPLIQQAMTETIRLAAQQSPDAIFVFETIRDDLRRIHPEQTDIIASSLDNYAFADASRHLATLAAALKLS